MSSLISNCKQLGIEKSPYEAVYLLYTVKNLLKKTHSSQIWVLDDNRNTAFYYACYSKYDVAELFITNKYITPYNITDVLLTACITNNVKVIMLLLRHIKNNINLNFVINTCLPNSTQDTLLHHICSNTNLDKKQVLKIVKFTVRSFDIDFDKQNKFGLTVLMLVYKYALPNYSSNEIIRYILQCYNQFNINLQDCDKKTALHYACGNSHVDINMLLDAGANPNIQNHLDNSCLHITLNHKNDYNVLLKYGANPNIINGHGYTPLMSCISLANKNKIKALLANPYIDVNVQCNNEYTALMLAVSHIEMFKKLVKRPDCDINLTNNLNQTALIIACKQQSLYCVKLLLNCNKKINLDTKDSFGNTALMYICNSSSNSENIKYIFKLLINAGASVDIQNSTGETALAVECIRKNITYLKKTVRVLVSKSNINKQNDKGMTSLMHICSLTSPHNSIIKNINKIIKFLVKRGADVNLKDKDGYSCLIYCTNIKTLNFLKQFITDISKKDLNKLKETYPTFYKKWIQERAVKEHVRFANKIKLVQFIPLRQQQMYSYYSLQKI